MLQNKRKEKKKNNNRNKKNQTVVAKQEINNLKKSNHKIRQNSTQEESQNPPKEVAEKPINQEQNQNLEEIIETIKTETENQIMKRNAVKYNDFPYYFMFGFM